MKHYVLGFVFNNFRINGPKPTQVLLIHKKRPEWQVGMINGIGGKIEEYDMNPLTAMNRESTEEIGYCPAWHHKVTFTCNGGTVFVFAGFTDSHEILYDQLEDEQLTVFDINQLPEKVIPNLKWLIPLCLANIKDLPLIFHEE